VATEVLVAASVGQYHGTTVEPWYFFFTLLVLSRSQYYHGTAIPQIQRYCHMVLASK